jgi:DNA-binding beta-propeller fold protein YncE
MVADTLRGQLLYESKSLATLPFTIRVNPVLDRVYVTDLFSPEVKEFDIAMMSVQRKIRVGVSQSDIAVSKDGATLYIARPLHGRIDEIDAVTLRNKRSFAAPRGVTRLALDKTGLRLFAVAFATGKLFAIDLREPKNTRKIDLHSQVRDMIYCPDSDLIYYSTPCAIFYLTPGSLMRKNPS